LDDAYQILNAYSPPVLAREDFEVLTRVLDHAERLDRDLLKLVRVARLVVWTERTGWRRSGSLAWQFFSRNGKAIGGMRVQPGLPVWNFAAVAAKPNGFVILY
jgi:hypothetical protein